MSEIYDQAGEENRYVQFSADTFRSIGVFAAGFTIFCAGELEAHRSSEAAFKDAIHTTVLTEQEAVILQASAAHEHDAAVADFQLMALTGLLSFAAFWAVRRIRQGKEKV